VQADGERSQLWQGADFDIVLPFEALLHGCAGSNIAGVVDHHEIVDPEFFCHVAAPAVRGEMALAVLAHHFKRVVNIPGTRALLARLAAA